MRVLARSSVFSSSLAPCGKKRRHYLSVYAMGEGWTGALGTGDLDSNIDGHDDQEEASQIPPPLVFEGKTRALATGWGHTALITENENKLYVCGRPQDFQALLRLKRLPGFLRQHAVNHALRNYFTREQDTTLVGRVLSWMVGQELDGQDGPWANARQLSVLPNFTPIPLPDGDEPSLNTNQNRILAASAGLTAVIGKSGTLYTFGTNTRGQCGVGETSNNVWTPQRVVGLSTQFAHDGRDKLEQEFPMVSVALGLQHGLALDDQGNLFAWGKGERGQLGQGQQQEVQSSTHALRVTRFQLPSNLDGSRRLEDNPVVTKIAAGMNRSAALTKDNHVYVWGKNILPPPLADKKKASMISDSPWPHFVEGLPKNMQVLDIACGSHHTAILLEDGSVFCVGLTSDTAQLVSHAMEIVPPGVVELPIQQFDAHFDRTTIVGRGGKQVLQVHLWQDEELQEDGIFTPPWVEHILKDDDTRIREIQRGWLHTIVATM